MPLASSTAVSMAIDALGAALRERFPELRHLSDPELVERLVDKQQLATLSEYFDVTQDSREQLARQLLNAG